MEGRLEKECKGTGRERKAVWGGGGKSYRVKSFQIYT